MHLNCHSHSGQGCTYQLNPVLEALSQAGFSILQIDDVGVPLPSFVSQYDANPSLNQTRLDWTGYVHPAHGKDLIFSPQSALHNPKN